MRPEGFTRPCRTSNITPYQIITHPADIPERGSSNGGVFHRGQIVWTQSSEASQTLAHTTAGFVDGLGYVLLDPRYLKEAEIVSSPLELTAS